MEPGFSPSDIDTSRPHPARVYNFYLGGKDNYPVDREAASPELKCISLIQPGRRVIGLTMSTNAARVMAIEGLAEGYNTAQFLGKLPGTERTRGAMRVSRDDVLVIDEASQVCAGDLAKIQAVASAGARVILVGDTAQLGAVEAGGMMRLVAGTLGRWELAEVRRFDAGWERDASLGLRCGNARPGPPTTRTAAPVAARRTRRGPGPWRCGWRTTCPDGTRCCWPGRMTRPPSWRGRPASARSSSGRWPPVRRCTSRTATGRPWATWCGPG